MKNLCLPNYNDNDLWESIVRAKHLKYRTPLMSIREQVYRRYRLYSENTQNLDDILPADSEDIHSNKDALISCYNDSVSFTPVKKELLSSVQRCPYCSIGQTDSIDHYFDKSEYPEYSVFTPNLVPCCSKCNRDKGMSCFDENGRRLFIHYYYDYIPSYKFVHIYLDTDSEGGICLPDVKVFMAFEDDGIDTTIIENHFKSLKLLSRYRQKALDKLPVILSEITRNKRFLSNEQIKETLKSKFESAAEFYGINSPESCIYDAILNSGDFLDLYLQV